MDKTIYIDVTRTNTCTLGFTHQKVIVSTDAVKVRQKAYIIAYVKKYDDYHAEASRRNALLLPFVVDSNGSFTPRVK